MESICQILNFWSKMPVDFSSLIRALAEICEEKELKATASGSFKGGLLTGVSATVGGLMLGPIGLALGGAIGGVVAAASGGEFKSVAQILMDMPYEKKQLLYRRMQRAFSNFNYEDVIGLAMLILSSGSFKELALKELTNFLVQDMGLSVKS